MPNDAPNPSPLALPEPSGDIVFCDAALLATGFEASRKSPRLRVMQPIHRTNAGRVQRLINFMQPGSYVRPHRHTRPHAIETVIVIHGAIALFLFDDDGAVQNGACLSAGHPGCLADLEPNVWHTLLPLDNDTALVEIKAGPYDAPTDKEFAPWAPAEDDPSADGYRRMLLSIVAA